MSEMNNKTEPLVSVRILTYNSSKYIVETLESVYFQTYSNIELIISDDCSSDNTVQVCRNWIKNKGSRFKRVELLTSIVNTGVCANSKRSLEATKGDYIKGLGGDDCLYPSAIEEYVRFMKEKYVEICAAKMKYMDDDSNDYDIKPGYTYDNYIKELKLSYKQQLCLINQRLFVPGPVLFYSRKIYLETGGPDEEFGAADEWSFIYKVIKKGYRIFGLEKELVRYRIRRGSLCRDGKNNKELPYYKRCSSLFISKVILPNLLREKKYIMYWHMYITHLMWGKSYLYRYLRLIDPLWYLGKIYLFRV